MIKPRIAFIVWMVIWGVILVIGIKLYLGVTAQRVPGYPNAGQLVTYVVFPGCLVVLNFLAITCCRKLHLSILFASFFVQLLMLPIYVIIGGGGV